MVHRRTPLLINISMATTTGFAGQEKIGRDYISRVGVCR